MFKSIHKQLNFGQTKKKFSTVQKILILLILLSSVIVILETENVAVMLDAQHYCVKSRGVEDTGSSTITSRLGGSFKEHPEVRAEFLSLLKV